MSSTYSLLVCVEFRKTKNMNNTTSKVSSASKMGIKHDDPVFGDDFCRNYVAAFGDE